ncbi:hypothetical protein BC829DRAFT_409745 [Chytridium lagenaria]|nr:hypothetical protein BC829DRAFT_409745 [Chytridium lagenaria]
MSGMSSSSDCSVVSSAFPSLRINATECCGDFRIQCDSTGRITFLYLYNNQLTGSIPSQLGNLRNLTYLFLYNNQLEGTIPQELGNLRILRELYLENNYLSGAVPEYVSNLSAKRYCIRFKSLCLALHHGKGIPSFKNFCLSLTTFAPFLRP